jgi:class 3 adenylate cyclase/tetratricopeptide (TPR) repeat protein
MVTCPRCHRTSPEGYRFCGQCGSALSVSRCPSCATAVPEGQPFCGQCGSPLDRAAPPSTALEERKLATVLFADVVGFTSLAERTDPEIVARMVDSAFRQLGETVAEHGGTVDKYMGDSLMAVFGVPTAHDDDAERAVAAGLAMRHLGGDLVFSIGINSGEVMATAMGRDDEVTVIGDTVNVAARLEKAAAPGEVLCGRLTAELAGDRVTFRARQPVLLKGKQEPVEVWEAVSLHAGGPELPGCGPPLVGRTDELSFLEAQWRRVRRDRQFQVVLVCGEAGSGKSRLAAELARLCEADGTVVRASYPAYGSLGGARVAADVIRQLGPVSDPEVDVRLRSIAGELHESLKSIDPVAMHQEQLWALSRLLQEKAADRPLLFVIDDVHRSGEQMLRLLGELSGRLGSVAVLTVLAGRTDPGDWLSWFPAATTVRLGPLSRTDALALAEGLLADKALAPEAAAFLVDRAGGNPLYLRELVATARAQGLLVDDAGRYRLSEAAAVPATLQALLAARLDALEPAQKRALQLAAVMGGASADHLKALGMPDAEATVSSLVELGLMRLSGDGRHEPVDSLLREVAYETLPRNVRGELHRQAASIVDGPAEKARHLERAAHYLSDDQLVAAEAAEALAEAADEYLATSRLADAVRLLEQAVRLGLRRPAALFELARAQALCGNEDGARDTLALVGDDPSDPTVAVERDHATAAIMMFTNPSAALVGLRDVTARWHALGVVDKEAWAHANTGVACFNLSHMEEAASELERGLELFERIGDRNGMVAATSFLCLARPTDRRVPQWLARALDFAEETGDRSRKLNALMTLAWHHTLRSLWGSADETAVAEDAARRLAELAEELGVHDLAVHGGSLLTIAARFTGRLDDAAKYAEALEQIGRSYEGPAQWLWWAATFAVAVGGATPGATPPFPPENSPDPVLEMAVYVIEAGLILAGRIDEALATLDRGSAPDLGVIGDLAGVLHGLALVLAGREAEAVPRIERAAQAARLLDAAPTARAAAALLAEIRGDTVGLPPIPERARSVSDALVLRAHRAAGDPEAAEALRRAARDLAMPGLLLDS